MLFLRFNQLFKLRPKGYKGKWEGSAFKALEGELFYLYAKNCTEG